MTNKNIFNQYKKIMNYNKFSIFAITALLASSVFCSCSKDDESDFDSEQENMKRNLKFDGAISDEYQGKYIVQVMNKDSLILESDTIDQVSVFVEGYQIQEMIFRNFPLNKLTAFVNKYENDLPFIVSSISDRDICSPYTKEYVEKDDMMVMRHKPSTVSLTAKRPFLDLDYRVYYNFSDNDTAYNVPIEKIYGSHALGNCDIKVRLEKIIGENTIILERTEQSLYNYIVLFQSRQIFTEE